MGAAVGVEASKPVDASDIRDSMSLEVARNEVIRLRAALGHLAKDAGFAEVVFDASDLVRGTDETEDFKRCVDEVVHIRSCLQLATQSFKRKSRRPAPATIFSLVQTEAANAVMDCSESESNSDADEPALPELAKTSTKL